MMIIKQFIKNYFPFITKIYKSFERKKKINNYFKTQHSKNALLSYITYPFTKKGEYFSHTNYFEAMSHAKILNELGYNVDVIDYDYQGKIDFSKYDLLVGFGESFVKCFEKGHTHLKTIHYSTGMEISYTNYISLKRVKDVYRRKGVLLFNSARYIEKSWMTQIIFVNAILALGNEICVESFKKYTDVPIYSIPGLFYKVYDGYEIIRKTNISNIKNNFIWFGSSGLVRKGLDLVLEFFSKNPDLKLHVCGPIKNELDFERVYWKELYETPNIITHGFVDIKTEKFYKILLDSNFVVFPSAIEGGSPSTLTIIGNGGLIPIITKETTISTGYEIWIEDFTVEAIEKAINKALLLSDKEILELRIKNLEYVLKNHTTEVYYKKLKEAYIDILGKVK